MECHYKQCRFNNRTINECVSSECKSGAAAITTYIKLFILEQRKIGATKNVSYNRSSIN